MRNTTTIYHVIGAYLNTSSSPEKINAKRDLLEQKAYELSNKKTLQMSEANFAEFKKFVKSKHEYDILKNLERAVRL